MGETPAPDSPKSSPDRKGWRAAVVDGCTIGSFVLDLLQAAADADASWATILIITTRLACVLLTRGTGSYA